jgi:hypothetical protein
MSSKKLKVSDSKPAPLKTTPIKEGYINFRFDYFDAVHSFFEGSEMPRVCRFSPQGHKSELCAECKSTHNPKERRFFLTLVGYAAIIGIE